MHDTVYLSVLRLRCRGSGRLFMPLLIRVRSGVGSHDVHAMGVDHYGDPAAAFLLFYLGGESASSTVSLVFLFVASTHTAFIIHYACAVVNHAELGTHSGVGARIQHCQCLSKRQLDFECWLDIRLSG